MLPVSRVWVVSMTSLQLQAAKFAGFKLNPANSCVVCMHVLPLVWLCDCWRLGWPYCGCSVFAKPPVGYMLVPLHQCCRCVGKMS